MAHVQKFKKDGSYGALWHDTRGEVNEHANESIDPARSYLNFNLVGGDPVQRYQALFQNDEIKILNRKNVNVMCGICITMPKPEWEKICERHPDDLQAQADACREYFRVSCDFLNGKFERKGTDNIISAIVHMDETTPHVHYKFMPLRENIEPKGKHPRKYNCDYDTVCPRAFYKGLHPLLVKEYAKHEEYAEFAQELNNGQTLGVESIKDYKESMDKLDELGREIISNKSEIFWQKQEIGSLNAELDVLRGKKEKLEESCLELEKRLKTANTQLEEVETVYFQKIADVGFISQSLEKLMQLRDDLIEVIKERGNGLYYAFQNQTDNYKTDIENGMQQTFKELERRKKSREDRER